MQLRKEQVATGGEGSCWWFVILFPPSADKTPGVLNKDSAAGFGY